ncbi:MAG: S24 family peptidase [Planctomycetota bacterium]
MKKEDKIIAEFEADLKAGKNPSAKDYLKRYGKLSDGTLGTLVMLGALYADRDKMRIPKSVQDKQMKLAQDLIDGKPTDWYFKGKNQIPDAVILDVPPPLTREKGGVPVVALAAAGKGQMYELDAILTEEGWKKITRPFDMPDKDVFGVEVHGDSLEPLIPNGSCAVIDPKKQARTNDLALVITNDYRACIKKIQIRGKKVVLISSNPEYPPQELDCKDVRQMYKVAWVKFK